MVFGARGTIHRRTIKSLFSCSQYLLISVVHLLKPYIPTKNVPSFPLLLISIELFLFVNHFTTISKMKLAKTVWHLNLAGYYSTVESWLSGWKWHRYHKRFPSANDLEIAKLKLKITFNQWLWRKIFW